VRSGVKSVFTKGRGSSDQKTAREPGEKTEATVPVVYSRLAAAWSSPKKKPHLQDARRATTLDKSTTLSFSLQRLCKKVDKRRHLEGEGKFQGIKRVIFNGKPSSRRLEVFLGRNVQYFERQEGVGTYNCKFAKPPSNQTSFSLGPRPSTEDYSMQLSRNSQIRDS